MKRRTSLLLGVVIGMLIAFPILVFAPLPYPGRLVIAMCVAFSIGLVLGLTVKTR